MKILYIYHEYFGRHEKYGHCMSELGNDVTHKRLKNKTEANQVDEGDIEKNYDLVWIISPFLISHKVISEKALALIKSKIIPIAVYAPFHTDRPYSEMLDTWNEIDYSFVQNREMSEYFREQGLNSYYIPIGFHPDQYYPMNLKKKYDITFIGSPQTTVAVEKDMRVKCIKEVSKHFKIKVFGKEFNKRGIKAGKCFTHKKHRKIYSQSRINLDLPYINSPHEFYRSRLHSKNRFFEIPATGGFLVTARFDEYIKILDDTMVGYYERDNMDSLIATIDKYLKDEKLREEMAEKAYKVITTQGHTYKDRFKQMLNIIKYS